MLLSGTITAITPAHPEPPHPGPPTPTPGVQIGFTTAGDADRHEILGTAPHRYRAVLHGPALLDLCGLQVGDVIEVDGELIAVRLHVEDGTGFVVGDLDVVSVTHLVPTVPAATGQE